MPSRPGEFSATGRSDHQPELETGGRRSSRIRREIWETRRGERRLVEKETSHPGRDRPNVEAAVGCEAADKLPGVPPMKRVFQHPVPSQTGKQYWRSLGELSDTPEFRDWLEREFPAGAGELTGVV